MIKASDYFVSVIVPVLDEADVIPGFLTELHGLLDGHYRHYELVAVQVTPSLETKRIIKSYLQQLPGMRYIGLSKDGTLETGIAAGLDTAIGDVVVILRPDGDPVEMLPKFVEEARKTNGIAFGISKTGIPEGFFGSFGRSVFLRIANWSFDFDLPPRNATHYMAMSRQTLNAILSIKDKTKYMRMFGALVGSAQSSIAYTPVWKGNKRYDRGLGESINLGVNIIVMNSTKPLRFASWLGVLTALLNLLVVVYVLLVNLFKPEVAPGWTTMSLQNSAMFFAFSVILAIMAEYMAHFYQELKDRPVYHVAEETAGPSQLVNKNFHNVVSDSNE